LKGNHADHGNVSGREEAILSLASEGVPDRIIAQRMGLSFGTVDSYWRRIRKRLNAASRTDAVAIWVRARTEERLEEVLRECLDSMRSAAGRTGDATLLREADALERSVRRQVPAAMPEAQKIEVSWPVPVGKLYGRQKELVAVRRFLDPEDGSHRLMTLWGPGGSGKTRLAFAAGHNLRKRYAERAWFVSLAPLADRALVWESAARSVGARPEAGTPPLARLKERCDALGRPCLLVLDNMEHLLMDDLTEDIVALLGSPHLRILVTSRRPLGIFGEKTVAALPLPVPSPDAGEDGILGCPSVKMFLDRIGRRLPAEDVRTAADICGHLDGVPLAIEIAAARARKIPLDEVLQQMRQPLSVPNRGPDRDPRHRSLEQALQWSYDLLKARQQRMLRACTVFRGGWILDSALAVSGDAETQEVLAELATHSLVSVTQNEHGSRYSMLEMVRQFADSKMSADERRSTRRKLVDLTNDARWLGQDKAAPIGYSPHTRNDEMHRKVWMELDNIRASFDYCLQHQWFDDAALIHSRFDRYFEVKGLVEEGWSNAVRLISTGGLSPGSEANTLSRASYLARKLGRSLEGLEFASRGERIAKEQGFLYVLCKCLIYKTDHLRRLGRVDEAFAYSTELLALSDANPGPEAIVDWLRCSMFEGFALDKLRVGLIKEAEAFVERARAYGGTGSAVYDFDAEFLGQVTRLKGDFAQSVALFERGKQRAVETSYRSMAAFFEWLAGTTHLVAGEYSDAQRRLETAASLYEADGLVDNANGCRIESAEATALLGDFEDASGVLDRLENRMESVSTNHRCSFHRARTVVAGLAGDKEVALMHSRKAVRFAYATTDVAVIAQCLERRAQIQDRFCVPGPRRARTRAESIRAKFGLARWL
jgi:predicted ATPase/DNA-binding CsgD family transcriptional regulator/tetratricopeptide (TPR) repeat protein